MSTTTRKWSGLGAAIQRADDAKAHDTAPATQVRQPAIVPADGTPERVLFDADAEITEADARLTALEERVRDGDDQVQPDDIEKARGLRRWAQLRREAAVRAAHPVFVRRDGDMEIWQKGPATVLVPVVLNSYPPELREAVQIRRVAVFEGCCPCGAEVRVTEAGHYSIGHMVTCPGSDEVLVPLATAAGVVTQRRNG
ncbi:hypothetical protein OG292_22445 [Streptomyces sp. NBC_01511]|uniref:hypothetical protein n=1 Tax=Streptomyces sp. NBC_01511 TaxID=2903889 RepID=UPI003863034B